MEYKRWTRVWEEMVLVKMLMDIDPLLMRWSLLMMMAPISPLEREVPLAEQLRWSPRLVPPRFCLETAALRPESFLMIFFHGKGHHIAEDGHRGVARLPMRQGARPGGRARPPPSWLPGGPPLVLSSPNIFNIFQNSLSGVSGLLELCRIGL